MDVRFTCARSARCSARSNGTTPIYQRRRSIFAIAWRGKLKLAVARIKIGHLIL